MHPDVLMLSPYVTIAFILSVFFQKEKWITLLTPITWVISTVGLAILFYKRFIIGDPLPSLFFFMIAGVESDYPLWVIKSIVLALLITNDKKWTRSGILLALCTCIVYLLAVDFRKIYEV